MIESEFPQIQWMKRRIFWQRDGEIPYLWCAESPFSQIPQKSGKLFFTQKEPPGTWLRRCYGRYGMGRGLIVYEDSVSLWNDNLPPHDKIDWNNTMRISGDWNVKVSGDYL